MKKDKDLIILAIMWLVIMLYLGYSLLVTSPQKTDLVLRANADFWEDYTSEIDHLHFGDKIRIAQLDYELIYNRAKAIACAEGYNIKGSVADRNNNPGNLKAGGHTDEQRHTIYDTAVEGWLALYQYLQERQHLTIAQIGQTYATDKNWARNVEKCAERL